MSGIPPSILPLAVITITAIAGFLGHVRARAIDPDRDSGAYWARVLWWVVGGLGVACWLSSILESFPNVFATARHLQFDRILTEWWAYPAALALPLIVWLGAVGLTAGWKSAPDDGRWIAGSIGRPASRLWLLPCTLPPLLLLGVGWTRLNEGRTGFPSATWTTLVLLIVTLVFLAFSAGAAPRAAAEKPEPGSDVTPTASLPIWPDAMREAGIGLQPVALLPHRPLSRRLTTPAAIDLGSEIDADATRHIAPELIELMAHVLTSRQVRGDQAALALAPDDCGQVEVLAHGARELFLMGNEATLIITPRCDPRLQRQVERWLPEFQSGQVHLVDGRGELPPEKAFIWMVDVQTLSDRFVEHLREHPAADRIGLVAWWELEAYTGVLAANVWAIARRFQRLMTRRRPDVRTIVFARDALHAEAQMAAFVRRLLPYRIPDPVRGRVEQGPARDVNVYRLEGPAERFVRTPDQWPPPDRRHATLIAALASLEIGWPTFFDDGREVQDEERRDVLDSRARTPLGERIVSSADESGARIRPIDDGEALALSGIVGQGGRASPPGLPHHVAITLSENPYVGFLFDQLGPRGHGAFGAKRLVAAESQASIIERHLLAALRERPDVRSKLLRTFLWEEDVVRRTLDELYELRRLSRQEVRFLESDPSKGQGPVSDYRYRNLLPPAERHPLDTVGSRLLEVRDPSAADREDKGVRMRVDPERLTIQAYPGRVFMAGGERYRIRDWTQDHLRRSEWLECQREGRSVHTWRIRDGSLTGMRMRSGRVPVDFRPMRDVRITRAFIDAHYHEIVSGFVRVEVDLTNGARRVVSSDPRQPVRMRQPFLTSAMLLYFDPEPDVRALSALALALSYVLPVHVGVEQDALEVLPIIQQSLERYPASASSGGHMERVSGVAIVDLYPGGIGLIDALEDDQSLLVDVLTYTRDWLLDIVAKGETHLLDTAIAHANYVGVSPAAAAPFLVGALGAGRARPASNTAEVT